MAPKLFSKQISRMDDGLLKKFCISMCCYKNSFSLVSWIQTKMSKLGFGQNNKQYGLMKLVFALSLATLVGIALFARFLGTSSSSISFTNQSIADNNVASDNHTNQDHQVIHWSFSSSSFLLLWILSNVYGYQLGYWSCLIWWCLLLILNAHCFLSPLERRFWR